MVIDEIEESVAMELPLIVGEFAHKAVGCVCCIPYQTIIEQCHKHDIGYFPWSWGPGNQDCEEMDMTEDGTFDTLHGWGEEVALTSPHSIQNVAVRPDWLVAATPLPSPTPAPTPVPPPLPEGLLSYNRPVRVSSSETSALAGRYAVDGRWDTRWSSAWTEPQTITVDLGQVHDIARIVLAWETAYGSAYRLQASDDGETWTPLIDQQNGDGGRDDYTVSATGRYVRMVGLERATEWGFSLWEFWVFDRADVELPEIPPEIEMAATPAPDDLRPDLVIANLTWSPKQPAPGDPVTFKVVVQNQGQSATRPGTQLRCGFYVDGAPVSWSAPYDKAILPQGLVTLMAQDGPDGDGVWSPGAEGGFVVTAWIDDAGPAPHNVVDERDEHNNLLAAHDLVRERPTATPGEIAEATSPPTESAAPIEAPTPLGTPTPAEGEVTPSLLALVLLSLLILVALTFVIFKK
jgi:hypothetical protein